MTTQTTFVRREMIAAVEPPDPFYAPIQTFSVDPKTLIFLLGELPFVTGLYERGRRELTDDDNLSVDGVKEMVLHARDLFKEKQARGAARITPQLLAIYFRYVRNLALVEELHDALLVLSHPAYVIKGVPDERTD